ncbi:allatostatin-A receptor-like [Glandiceps talaboti]
MTMITRRFNEVTMVAKTVQVEENETLTGSESVLNVTEDELKYFLYSKESIIIVTIVMPIIFAVGFLGNMITVIVLLRRRKMRTITNYFLVNLAIVDTIFLLAAEVRFERAENGHRTCDKYPEKARRKLVVMLAVTVLVYLICVGPFRTIDLLNLYNVVIPDACYKVALDISRMMLYLNSVINPIIYNVFNNNMRAAYVSLVKCS